MKTQKELEFESYFKNLFDQLIFTYSTFEIYKHVLKISKDKLEEINFAPTFFSISLQSLFSETIITLCKIFKSGKNNKYNMYDFLNFVKENMLMFSWENKIKRVHFQDADIEFEKSLHNNVDESIIKVHIKNIEIQNEIIKNLFFWRDKHLAHNDKDYFLKAELIAKDAPITYGEISNLINLAKDIMNYYSIAYNGIDNSLEAFTLFDIDNLLNALEDYIQIKRKDFENKYLIKKE